MSVVYWLPAGLEAGNSISATQLQQHTCQLNDLASTYRMLQQQLVALTNQVDPAAAAMLSAAAAGDKAATAKFCRLMGTSSSSGLPVDCLHSGVLPDMAAAAGGGGSDAVAVSTDGSSLHSWLSRYNVSPDSSSSEEPAAAAPTKAGTGGGVLRHLPVAMRLVLLENGLQELVAALAGKAPAGESLCAHTFYDSALVTHQPLH